MGRRTCITDVIIKSTAKASVLRIRTPAGILQLKVTQRLLCETAVFSLVLMKTSYSRGRREDTNSEREKW